MELAAAVTIRREDLWIDAFFEALPRVEGRVTVAAELAGVHRVTVYRKIRRSPDFRDRVDAVMRRLRAERVRRASNTPIP